MSLREPEPELLPSLQSLELKPPSKKLSQSLTSPSPSFKYAGDPPDISTTTKQHTKQHTLGPAMVCFIVVVGVVSVALIVYALVKMLDKKSNSDDSHNSSAPSPPQGYSQGLCISGFYDITRADNQLSPLQTTDVETCDVACQWRVAQYADQKKACVGTLCTCQPNTSPPPSGAFLAQCPPGASDVTSTFIIPSPAFGLICQYD